MPDHVSTNTTISTTIYQTQQDVSLTRAAVDHTNSGVYEVRACNLVGCKVDQWRVVVECKLYSFLLFLNGFNT